MRWLTECHNAIHWGNNLRIELFKLKNLGYLVLLAVLVTLAVGLILFLIDPNIHSPFDGIWSAWVTMTHVGFGDVVPISFFGRLLAAGLILFGLVFFSLFTALVSVALIGRNMDALGVNMRQIEQGTNRIQTGEDRRRPDSRRVGPTTRAPEGAGEAVVIEHRLRPPGLTDQQYPAPMDGLTREPYAACVMI